MARCEHDAVMAGANNEMMFLNIKALNEWDSKVRELRQMFMTVLFLGESMFKNPTVFNHTTCMVARAALN